MKNMGLLLGVLVLALAAGPALAQDNAGQARKEKQRNEKQAEKSSTTQPAKSALRGQYAIMASELKLTDPQKEQIAKLVQARQEALSQWEKGPQGQKLAELRKAVEEARKAKDKAAAEKAAAEIKALQAERQQIELKSNQEIMDVLTPEQQTQWRGLMLYTRLMARFQKAQISEEQKQTIRKMAQEAASKLSKTATPEEMSKATAGLSEEITQKVLTDEQRGRLKGNEASQPHSRPAREQKEPAKGEGAPK